MARVQVLPKSIDSTEFPHLWTMWQEVLEHPSLIDSFYAFMEQSLKMAQSMRTYDTNHQRLVDAENALKTQFEEMQQPLMHQVEEFNKWAQDYHSNVAVEHANAAAELMKRREEFHGYPLLSQNKTTQD